MKKAITLILLSALCVTAKAQSFCQGNVAFSINKTERFENSIHNAGAISSSLKWKINDIKSLSKVIGRGDFNPLANIGFYAMGTTDSDEIVYAGKDYSYNSWFSTDWKSGLDNDWINVCEGLNSVFLVTKDQARIANELYETSQISGEPISCEDLPESILYWPTKSNPFISDIGIEKGIEEVPFYDRNGDNIYDPCMGDLPSFEDYYDFVNDGFVENHFPQSLSFTISSTRDYHAYTSGKVGGFTAILIQAVFNVKREEYLVSDLIIKESDSININNLKIGLSINSWGHQTGFIPEDKMVIGLSKDTSRFRRDIGNWGLCLLDNEEGSSEASAFVYSDYEGDIYSSRANDQAFYNWAQGLEPSGDSILFNSEYTTFMYSGNPKDYPEYADQEYGVGMLTTQPSIPDPSSSHQRIRMANFAYGDDIINDSRQLSIIAQRVKELNQNKWEILRGPDAPDLQATSVNNEKIRLTWDNKESGNNFDESYKEIYQEDIVFELEGYKIYQLSDYDLDLWLIGDPSYSTLVYQCDRENGINDIANWEQQIIDDSVSWVQKNMVRGEDRGIQYSVELDYDFIGDKPIVANQEYYYAIVAYGTTTQSLWSPSSTDQKIKEPYLESTQNVKIIGTQLELTDNEFTSEITRLSGSGTNNLLELKEDQRDILFRGTVDSINYASGKGPFSVWVWDSTKLDLGARYELEIIGDNLEHCRYDSTAYWDLKDLTNNEIVISGQPIYDSRQVVVKEKGFTISIAQNYAHGENSYFSRVLENKVKYEDEDDPWLLGLQSNQLTSDSLGKGAFNYFWNTHPDTSSRSKGERIFFPVAASIDSDSDSRFLSPVGVSATLFGNYFTGKKDHLNKSDYIPNIDLVFTSDKNKWSRCIVVETGNEHYFDNGYPAAIDGDTLLRMRSAPSLDVNGIPETGSTGYSWFPGYAIDVETGERLNVFFGENSALSGPNANLRDPSIASDMLFNPSDELIDESKTDGDPGRYLIGGHHFVYVTSQKYDGCDSIGNLISSGSFLSQIRALKSVHWYAIPYLREGFFVNSVEEGLVPNDVVVELRAARRFRPSEDQSELPYLECPETNNNSKYRFSLIRSANRLFEEDDWLIDIINQVNHFEFTTLKDVTVNVSTIAGAPIKQSTVLSDDRFVFRPTEILPGIYLIVIKTADGQKQKSFRMVVVE